MVQRALLRLHVVRRLYACLSVTLVDQDRVGWKSWKLTARAIRPTPSFSVAQRPSTYSQRNLRIFWVERRCWAWLFIVRLR